ncbi:sulfur carrier protein ThiS [Thermodesulfobacteriota bacterium]
MITFTCNGEAKELPQTEKLIDFIRSLELDPETIVVEMNGAILQRDQYDSIFIDNGTVLELIRFVGGG